MKSFDELRKYCRQSNDFCKDVCAILTSRWDIILCLLFYILTSQWDIIMERNIFYNCCQIFKTISIKEIKKIVLMHMFIPWVAAYVHVTSICGMSQMSHVEEADMRNMAKIHIAYLRAVFVTRYIYHWILINRSLNKVNGLNPKVSLHVLYVDHIG